MAAYGYECTACKEQFEVNVPMSQSDRLDQEPPRCPTCGTSETRRVVSTFYSKLASTW